MFKWNLTFLICVCCLFCQWILLRRVWLYHLCSFPWEWIYPHMGKIPCSSILFPRLNSPRSLSLIAWEMLQSLNKLFGPFLDSLQYAHVCLVLGSPALGTALQAWPHQCWAEEKDHLSWPADNALPNAARDSAGCFCCEGTLLARGHFVVYQDPMSPALLLSSWSAPPIRVYWLPGAVPARVLLLGISFCWT